MLIYAYVSAETQLGFYPQLSNIVTGKLSNTEVSNSFLLLHSDRPQDEPWVSSQAFYLISKYFFYHAKLFFYYPVSQWAVCL